MWNNHQEENLKAISAKINAFCRQLYYKKKYNIIITTTKKTVFDIQQQQQQDLLHTLTERGQT